MRRLAAFIVVVVGFTLMSPPPADACSCAVVEFAEVAERADAIFIGNQVDQRDGFLSQRRVLVMQVEASFKGDVGDTVELHTYASSASCGISFQHGGLVGVVAYHHDDGNLHVDSCGSGWDAEEVRLFFDGVPEITGSAIDFYVGTSGAGAEIAALDPIGRPVAWGEGAGRVTAITMCPGAEVIATIVEFGERWEDLSEPVVIRLRDARTLAVVGERSFEVSPRPRQYTNGQWWLDDLACHSTDGSEVTFLTRTYRYDDYAAAYLLTGGEAHVWTDADHVVHDLALTRAIAVDLDAGVIYGISGDDGEHLDRWDAETGERLGTQPVPNGASAWDIALLDGRLAIASRHAPADMINRWFEEVDQLVLLAPNEGAVTITPMRQPGQLVGFQASSDGVAIVAMTMMRHSGSEPGTFVSRFSIDGELSETLDLEYVDVSFRSAVGSERVALSAWGQRLILDDGRESARVSGILEPLAVASTGVFLSTTKDEIAPVATTPSSTPGTTPAVVEATEAAGATVVPPEDAAVEQDPAIEAGSDVPLAVWIAVAIGVGTSGALLLRWRRIRS